jgi:hypothetical protein
MADQVFARLQSDATVEWFSPRRAVALAKADLILSDQAGEGGGYRPGVFRCAKCDLRSVQMNMDVSSGTVEGAHTADCPNGCGPAWPVTWKDDCLSAERELEQAHERLSKVFYGDEVEPLAQAIATTTRGAHKGGVLELDRVAARAVLDAIRSAQPKR